MYFKTFDLTDLFIKNYFEFQIETKIIVFIRKLYLRTYTLIFINVSDLSFNNDKHTYTQTYINFII